MPEAQSPELVEAIEEAVTAFDAANLVWGQFYRHTWLRLPEAERARAQPVREALGDAALSVPQAGTDPDLRAFFAALLAARERLLAFIEELGPGGVPGDVREVPEALLEAAGCLEPYLGESMS